MFSPTNAVHDADNMPAAFNASQPQYAAVAARPVKEQPLSQALRLLNDELLTTRRLVHAGDVLYRAGESCDELFVLSSGFVKLISLASDGREQVSGFKFRGDWLGFDGIATGRYQCEAVAMDTGEVRTVRYSSLISAAARRPAVLTSLLEAMSRQIMLDRESMMAICSMPADARVADFLRYWSESLEECGLRGDRITLRLSRAEIGGYLGMTLESVSRGLSRLAREKIICFESKGRNELRIPDAAALSNFVQRSLASSPTLQ